MSLTEEVRYLDHNVERHVGEVFQASSAASTNFNSRFMHIGFLLSRHGVSEGER